MSTNNPYTKDVALLLLLPLMGTNFHSKFAEKCDAVASRKKRKDKNYMTKIVFYLCCRKEESVC